METYNYVLQYSVKTEPPQPSVVKLKRYCSFTCLTVFWDWGRGNLSRWNSAVRRRNMRPWAERGWVSCKTHFVRLKLRPVENLFFRLRPTVCHTPNKSLAPLYPKATCQKDILNGGLPPRITPSSGSCPVVSNGLASLKHRFPRKMNPKENTRMHVYKEALLLRQAWRVLGVFLGFTFFQEL